MELTKILGLRCLVKWTHNVFVIRHKVAIPRLLIPAFSAIEEPSSFSDLAVYNPSNIYKGI